ncbi:MAG TPA: amidohydrolase, partial [Devosia sp.]|nr:amidohydrolase [Devosia sp.]
ATLHKACSGDATAVSTRQVLHMATLGGARALGAEKDLGSLEKGKRADFIRVETGSVHALPLFDKITHLVYSTNRQDVRDVFVGGRRVVHDRRITTLDTDKLKEEIKRLAPRIAASLKEQ